MGRAGRDLVERFYGPERHISGLLDLYQQARTRAAQPKAAAA
jgi:hypothetical protein